MEQTLKITLTADNRSALTGLRETVTGLQGVSTAAAKTNSALASTGDAVKKNTTMWMNLGRVVQDAPYGFNGIANNLTQLIPAAGALGFAFSSLITAITFSQVGMGAWTRSAKQTKTAADDLAGSIGSLNDVNNEANKTAGEQITSARYLYNAATDLNVPIAERLKYAKELKAEFPAILSNITAEAIANGTAKVSYDELTKSIIANARAKAAATKIGELETEKMRAENNIMKIQAVTARELANAKGYSTGGEASETVSAERERAMIVERRDKALSKETETIKSLTTQQEFLARAVGTTNIANALLGSSATTATTKISDLQKILNTLSGELRSAEIEKGLGFTSELDSNIDKVKAYNKAILDLAKIGLTEASEQMKKLVAERDKFFGISGSTPFQQGAIPIESGIQIGSPSAPQTIGDEHGKQIDKLVQVEKQTQANKDAQVLWNDAIAKANVLTNLAMSSFSTLFEAIKQGKDPLEAIGQVFADVAAQIAKAAIKAAIFSAILAAVSGGTSMAVGAVAGAGKKGGSFLDIFKGLLGFSDGGIVSGPQSGYPIMAHGTEMILNGNQVNKLIGAMGAAQGPSAQNIQVFGVIAGNDIHISNQRTSYQRGLTTGIR